jgi:outer membrane lipopolysaccharide assembly protein LptE/RlpB
MRIDRALAIAAAVAALSLTACASRLRGEMSYDEGTDFSRYRTYSLVPLESGSPTARPIAEREVKRALEAKGLRAVERATADVLVRVLLDRRHKTRLSGSIAPGGEYVGMEVTLDDRKSGERVWSSWAAETYNDQLQAETEIPKAVDLIFESYPPK